MNPVTHHPLLQHGPRHTDSDISVALQLDAGDPLFLDHRVAGRPIWPGAALLELALAAGRQYIGGHVARLTDVRIKRPLAIDGAQRTAGIRIVTGPDGVTRFEIASRAGDPPYAGEALGLRCEAPGDFSGLKFARQTLPPRRPDSLVVQVYAAALNDSLVAGVPTGAGAASGVAAPGVECVGVVTSVGRAVRRFGPGDLVLACAPGCVGSSVVVPESLALPIPPGWRMLDAVALPVACMTAYQALIRLARLRKGEHVLIHRAASDLGWAALKIAGRCGARVIATAETDASRDYLRSLGLEHVFSSRDGNFAGDVRRLTRGRGVEVLFNALSPERLRDDLSVLAHSGRMVDVGRPDGYSSAVIGLHALRRNLTFLVADIPGCRRSRPREFSALFRRAIAYVVEGGIEPMPVRLYDSSQVHKAFELMTRRLQVGKIVLDMSTLGRGGVAPDEVLHCRGVLAPGAPASTARTDIGAALARCPPVDFDVYARFRETGIVYGPGFRLLRGVRCGDGEALARVEVDGRGGFVLSPMLLDAALQLLGVPLLRRRTGASALYVPVAISSLSVYDSLDAVAWIASSLDRDGRSGRVSAVVAGSARLLDPDGRVLVDMQGIKLRRVNGAMLFAAAGDEAGTREPGAEAPHARSA